MVRVAQLRVDTDVERVERQHPHPDVELVKHAVRPVLNGRRHARVLELLDLGKRRGFASNTQSTSESRRMALTPFAEVDGQTEADGQHVGDSAGRTGRRQHDVVHDVEPKAGVLAEVEPPTTTDVDGRSKRRDLAVGEGERTATAEQVNLTVNDGLVDDRELSVQRPEHEIAADEEHPLKRGGQNREVALRLLAQRRRQRDGIRAARLNAEVVVEVEGVAALGEEALRCTGPTAAGPPSR